MSTVTVEVEEGNGPMLVVPAAELPDVADEQQIGVAFGPVPGLPGVTIIVFTATVTDAHAACEVPEGDTVNKLLFVPLAVGLPVADEDSLTVLAGVPGTVLVLLKTA